MLSKTVSHGQFSFGLRDPGLADHFVDNVELDHRQLRAEESIIEHQVLDAKGHNADCQLPAYSRKMTTLHNRLSNCVIGQF